MQRCNKHTDTYTHHQAFSRRETQCHPLTVVSTFVCLFFSSILLLLLLLLLLSCPPTVHPFIPDPVIFWSISKRRREEERRRGGGNNILPLFLCSYPSPFSNSPRHPSPLLCLSAITKKDLLDTFLTFNYAWLHTRAYSTCTHKYKTHKGLLWVAYKRRALKRMIYS